MNCELSQRRLLEAPSPEEPPPEVAAHLLDCPACRAWQRQLLRIERHVPLLPIPLSKSKERFLRSLQNEPGPVSINLEQLRRRRLPRRPLYIGAGGLAAAVALIVLIGPHVFRGPRDDLQANSGQASTGKQAGPASQREQPAEPAAQASDALVARLMECNLRLAQAGTPRQRVQMLADLADVLRDEAKTLGRAAAPEALETVTAMYARVIRDGLVQRAGTLPGAERREVLNPIAARLANVEHEVDEVARAAGPTTAERLRRLGLVARDGDVQLRALIQGGAP
jgi:hypothetical protein